MPARSQLGHQDVRVSTVAVSEASAYPVKAGGLQNVPTFKSDVPLLSFNVLVFLKDILFIYEIGEGQRERDKLRCLAEHRA